MGFVSNPGVSGRDTSHFDCDSACVVLESQGGIGTPAARLRLGTKKRIMAASAAAERYITTSCNNISSTRVRVARYLRVTAEESCYSCRHVPVSDLRR